MWRGTISESDSSSLLSSSTYHHQWLLNCIDDMMRDKDNKGLIIFVNSPGGSVYASDELYYKIKEYQKKTGRPVYSYMASEAASGGYYISSPCDRIIANRNCWTGSIGVTIGTLYDVTGLLKKMGVRTVTITSGRNKAMGSSAVKMTSEQRKIFQGLVDEAYDQFVGVVASGRHMKAGTVRKLADGRVYTAKQAKTNGLIDEIATFDQAKQDMKTRYNLQGVDVQDIQYAESSSFLGSLLGSFMEKKLSGTDIGDLLGVSEADSQYDQIRALLGSNNKFTVTYMSNVSK
jgi:protease-4